MHTNQFIRGQVSVLLMLIVVSASNWNVCCSVYLYRPAAQRAGAGAAAAGRDVRPGVEHRQVGEITQVQSKVMLLCLGSFCRLISPVSPSRDNQSCITTREDCSWSWTFKDHYDHIWSLVFDHFAVSVEVCYMWLFSCLSLATDVKYTETDVSSICASWALA